MKKLREMNPHLDNSDYAKLRGRFQDEDEVKPSQIAEVIGGGKAVYCLEKTHADPVKVKEIKDAINRSHIAPIGELNKDLIEVRVRELNRLRGTLDFDKYIQETQAFEKKINDRVVHEVSQREAFIKQLLLDLEESEIDP